MSKDNWVNELSVGKTNEIVNNPYTGASEELKPLEVAVYDYIKGCEGWGLYNEMQKGLDWFRKSNPNAYMTLLD